MTQIKKKLFCLNEGAPHQKLIWRAIFFQLPIISLLSVAIAPLMNIRRTYEHTGNASTNKVWRIKRINDETKKVRSKRLDSTRWCFHHFAKQKKFFSKLFIKPLELYSLLAMCIWTKTRKNRVICYAHKSENRTKAMFYRRGRKHISESQPEREEEKKMNLGHKL